MNYIATYFKITQHQHEFMVGKMLPSTECELFSDGLKHTYYNDEIGNEITFFPQGTFEYVTLPVPQIKCSYGESEKLRNDFENAIYYAVNQATPPSSKEELERALSKKLEINILIHKKFREKHKPIGNPWLTDWERESDSKAGSFCHSLAYNSSQKYVEDPLKEYGYTLAEHQELDILKMKNNLFYQELRKKITDEWNAKYRHLGIIFGA